ncbi:MULTISPECIES: flagellar brake protein [unclassified Janthinobacterium]|uniref:flagellar brake protein n=1 Tax=unclassified Janthinobacterium TaxID=2610881 RepID=UPI0016075810|nr:MULTISPECIES: flagellar brake protein [unclassified Janthinobacterium]MBB5368145.1 c-di-GMP-binding flagellar brake protein YcgR [Janthinobacterium sp. K2C7]MBB5379377.1 c-di-GMP-binding flagellar brake protein YcgR [Janthinobacterium sp. K2Li3]MBB5386527.1 c-di-GMP-binding flagellar brake protein YcgR [Janthinobacterium sp. K2E3]
MTSNKPATETKLQEFEFEAMNLQVGGRIQFITHRAIKPIQHFSTLIGYIKDEYLIVKIPMDNGGPIVLNEGDKLTIRVFSGVTVCSFACSVLRIFGRPLNYAHLSFPDAIQGTSLRTAMRVKVEIPAQLSYAEEAAMPVQIVNLSVSGALIESPAMLTPGDKGVTLSFTLLAPPNRHQMRLDTRARIQNVSVGKPPNGHADAQAAIHTYGLQFIDLEPTHYTLLQNLTYEALIVDRQKIV